MYIVCIDCIRFMVAWIRCGSMVVVSFIETCSKSSKITVFASFLFFLCSHMIEEGDTHNTLDWLLRGGGEVIDLIPLFERHKPLENSKHNFSSFLLFHLFFLLLLSSKSTAHRSSDTCQRVQSPPIIPMSVWDVFGAHER